MDGSCFQEEVLASASSLGAGYGTDRTIYRTWDFLCMRILADTGRIVADRKITGDLELYKESGQPVVTEGNAAYSLEGAQYGVYRDGGDYVNPDAVITTDVNGYGKAEGLLVGEYWIKELVPPKGYALNSAWSESTVSVPGGQSGVYRTTDQVIHETISVLLEKRDVEQGGNVSEEEKRN